MNGQYHTFWVHRFFKWDNWSFRADPNIPPVWVQYLNQPNHEPTKLLTPTLKAKIWAEDPDSEPGIEF